MGATSLSDERDASRTMGDSSPRDETSTCTASGAGREAGGEAMRAEEEEFRLRQN